MNRTFRSSILVGTACASLAVVLAPASAAPSPIRVTGEATIGGAGGAFTYDSVKLPVGARIAVKVTYPANGTTIVKLHVKDAVPNREYGAHAHVAACGGAGSAAGGHFQFVPFPAGSTSTDPAYANEDNEVWLDLVTDGDGNGTAQSIVDWQPESRRPMSVVIHDAHTSTNPGSAGTAGPRLGCMTVPF